MHEWKFGIETYNTETCILNIPRFWFYWKWGQAEQGEGQCFSWMMCSTWCRAALLCWTDTTARRSPAGSAATTRCYDPAVSLPPELGFLAWICSVKFRMWESGSACTPGSVPETSSFLWKVKQIWLSNDNHMPGAVQAHGEGRRRVDVKPLLFITELLLLWEGERQHFSHECMVQKGKIK